MSTATGTPAPRISVDTAAKNFPARQPVAPQETAPTQQREHSQRPRSTFKNTKASPQRTTKHPTTTVPIQLQGKSHPAVRVEGKPTGLRKANHRRSKPPQVDYSALKGFRKPPQLHTHNGKPYHRTEEKQKPAGSEAKHPKAAVNLRPDVRLSAVRPPEAIAEEVAAPTAPSELSLKAGMTSPTDRRGKQAKSLRISARQPERKAREKLELAKKRREMQRDQQPRSAIFSGRGPQPGPPPHPPPPPPPPSPPADTPSSPPAVTVSKPIKLAMPVPRLPHMWKHDAVGASSLEMALEDAVERLQGRDKIKTTVMPEQENQASSGEEKENETMSITPMKDFDAPDRPTSGITPHSEEGTGPGLELAETSITNADVIPVSSPPSVGIQRREALDTPKDSSSSTRTGCNGEFTDRDVLRGLHIAASAACDDAVDAWIREKTGVWIRRFLADLRAFEMLGEQAQPDRTEQRARRRRVETRKLKAQVRRSRMARQGLS